MPAQRRRIYGKSHTPSHDGQFVTSHYVQLNEAFSSKAKAATLSIRIGLHGAPVHPGPPAPAIPAVTTPATRPSDAQQSPGLVRIERDGARGSLRGHTPGATCVQLRRRILPVEVRCHPAATAR